MCVYVNAMWDLVTILSIAGCEIGSLCYIRPSPQGQGGSFVHVGHLRYIVVLITVRVLFVFCY